MSQELGDPPRGRGPADAGALGASAAEGDVRADAARAAGDEPTRGAPRTPSAPPSEPRRPSLPPAPATVPRPITRSRGGASQPPPAAAAPSGRASVVPAAPRAPEIDAFQDPYDGEVTTTYDPFGDDAPTADYDPRLPLYDPRARGTYANPLPGPATSRSPSAPPPVPSLGSEPPTARVAAPPRPTGGPPSSQKRRSSRRTVRIPDEAPERIATPTTSLAAAGEPPTPLDELTPEPETTARPEPGEFDESMRIMPMRIVNIGSEPPGRLPPPSRPPPPPVSPPPPAAVPRAPSLPPEVVQAPRDVLEQGWTPLPPAVADAQPTVPVMPAVTDDMLAAAGLTERAFAERAAEEAEKRLADEARAAAARVAEAARKAAEVARAAAVAADVARGEAASVTASTLPPEAADIGELDEAELADSEPEPELEVIETVEAARPPPPPARPAPPQRPATPPPSATAPAPPAAAAPPTAALEEPAKKPKAWWDDLFGDDYIRTFDRLEPRHVKREVDFIEESLGLESGAVILDLACGVGQQAVELASRGYSVVGFDLSLPMLSRAADEAQERGQRINFLHGDMREMQFDEMFDGIYCWSTSFGYFDEERNLAVLQRIHRALRQGGNFLLDVVNRDYVASRAPSLVWFEGEGCTCMDDMYVDFFTSRLRVKRTAMFDDGHSRELDYSIRLYTLHELGKMLHETGFKVVEVTGHPAHPGVFFGAESPRMIILAERA